MTLESTTSPVKDKFLSEEQQKAVIKQVIDNYGKGRRARQEKEETWQRCWRAYHNYVDKNLYRKQPWRSKLHLPWTFQAVEAGATELQDLLLPNDEDFFSVAPITTDDAANGEVMTKYLQYLFRQMAFVPCFSLFIKQLCVIGNSVLKVYWKQDKRIITQRRIDPLTGQSIKEKMEDLVYDAPMVEAVDIQDFVLYPATGNINKAMCIHRIVKSLEEVQNNPIYGNTKKIKPKNVSSHVEPDAKNYKLENSSVFGINTHEEEAAQDGVELLEAWGDFTIEGKTYRNHVATIANNNTIIRFQPNPYDYGLKPFVFATLITVPGQIYGVGLVEPSLGLQSMANTISNIMLDEMKLKLNGQWKYEEDGVFNPQQFVSRPGGTVKVGSVENLVPLQPNLNLNVGFAELNSLKGEYEETSGVTKYSKGAESTGKTRTAREAILLQQAGNKKFTRIAKHLNDTALTKTVELVYLLVRQFGDPQEISRYTNVPIEQIDINIPLSMLDFKITGLQTSLLKQQNIENTERFVTGVARTPGGQYLRWDVLTRNYYKLLGFEDPQAVMLDPATIQQLQQVQLMQSIGVPPEIALGAMMQQAPGAQPEGQSPISLQAMEG